VARLQLTLQLGLLTGNHTPLVSQLLTTPKLTSPADLVHLDSAAWTRLLATEVNGVPVGIPPGVPGATPAEQTANYVRGLVGTLQAAFPNQTIANLVATNTAIVSDDQLRVAVTQFFASSPDFDIATTRISSYLAAHAAPDSSPAPDQAAQAQAAQAQAAPDQAALAGQLQRLQRAFQISVSTDSMTALLTADLDAAHKVANIPRQLFADRYREALGGEDTAYAIHDRAEFVNARSVEVITQLNDAVNGLYPIAISGQRFGNGSSQAQQTLVDAYPDFAELFGALDPCNCDDCTSAISPTAYFVDLLQFLANSNPNAATNTPLDVLIGNTTLTGRRPDLAYLKLTCDNTNTELPYIDLVNEVLESYILYSGPTQYAAHDTGSVTTPALDASPQYTLDQAQYPNPAGSGTLAGPYLTLSTAVFPFTLPYNQPIAVARTYLGSLGTTRYQVLSTFQTSPSAAAAAIDAEYLSLDPYLYQLLTGTDLAGAAVAPPPLADLYGYPAAPPSWESTVAAVPAFLAQTGIGFTDLTNLLLTAFANPNAPTGPDLAFLNELPLDYATLMAIVTAGFTTTDPTVIANLADAGITLTEIAQWWGRHPDIGQMLVIYSTGGGCDIDDAIIAQLATTAPPTDADLNQLQAFIRFWQVLGWSVADLDRACTALGATSITPALIAELAQTSQLQAALNPPALQALFALWANLDPNGSDSLYLQLFVNPAALPNDQAFAPAADGSVLTDSSVLISAHLPALVAALGVSATDLSLICAAAGLTENSPLTLANVSTMYRYATLALALGLDVADFITIRDLAGPDLDPFASPKNALSFITLAADVSSSGFTATQLAYLYQQVSAPPTGLAPQPTTLEVLALALRDGLAQIAAQCAIGPDPKGTATASAITQLLSKTVATQAVAWVNGTATSGTPLTTLPASIAQVDGSGDVTGVNPSATPAPVGAKLSYDPGTGTLGYAGAMTTTEYTDLQAVSADPDFQAALAVLYAQPTAFLTANLAPLLDDPNAASTLFRTTASLDGQLNQVLVDASGTVVTDPSLAASTAIAAKFGYLLGKLLPYLQNLLSHTLAKQTIADTFGLDPNLTATLLETVLTEPADASEPVIGDLLALATGGSTAAFYPSPDLSGPPAFTQTVSQIGFDGSAPAATLPAGTQSASFTSWLAAPASGTFTFRVQTNGTPQLFVGDSNTAVTLAPDPVTGLPAATVTLSAGGLAFVQLDVTALPASGTAVLTWQNATTPSAQVPAAVQLPSAVFTEFGLAYVRIQKAALLAGQFGLTATEIGYLTAAGGTGLFGGFDLNALPLVPGISAAAATALFASWIAGQAYTALRGSLPNGSVSLVDVFSAASFAAAAALIPQATGWDASVVSALLAAFYPAPAAGAPNPFTDATWLTTAQACVDLVQQTGASVAQLFSWASYSWPDAAASYAGLAAIGADIKNAASSRYDPQTWLTVVAEPLSDTMRSGQRAALVAYLLGQFGVTDPDDLFDLLLIDPEMGTCMQTTRVAQAINSVQLFVQRCLLNLEAEGSADVMVSPGQIDAPTWQTWMGSYSLWAANREVFFYPENWLLPPLRDDQTPLYQAFASALQQGTVTNEAVSALFLTYLQGLDQVDRLDIRTVYFQPPDPAVKNSAGILHVFGRTFHTPKQYFYRQLISGQGWTPWQQVQADIEGDHLVAVIWAGNLRLTWPVFTQQAYTAPPPPSLTSSSGGQQTPVPGPPPQNYWQVTLAWTEYYQGAWQPKNVTDDFLLSAWTFDPSGESPSFVQPDISSHVFQARVDGADLVVDVYAELPLAILEGAPAILGEFRFSACGDSVSVSYDQSVAPTWPASLGVAQSVHQSAADAGISQTITPPDTDPHYNGFLQGAAAPPGLALWVGDYGNSPNEPERQFPPITNTTFLNGSPSQFELRVSQQDWQFAQQNPFFYQDNDRTFFVQPSQGWPVTYQLGDPVHVDLPGLLVSALTVGQVAEPVKEPAKARSAAGAVVVTGASAAAPVTWVESTEATSHNWATPTQLLGSIHLPPTVTLLSFQTHRHPYVCDLIQDLVAAQGQQQSGGISGLLNIGNQNPASGFSFQGSYQPVTELVPQPWPTETIDFSAGGAYADYNWELFFHAPLLVALTLSQNQQFADADAWFRYIFNPTDSTPGVPVPDRFWQVQPFRDGVPQTLLALMEAIDQGDPSAVAQVTEWKDNPFEPFPIARLRISAFGKSVFMAYLDNLIAWGDYLYGQIDTMESVNQATQLYIFASQLLGDLPVQIPSPQSPVELSYSQIRSRLDSFSNFIETVENEFPYAGPVTTNPSGQAGGLLGVTNLFFFCIPPNQQLMQYWSTVAGRLYNIRNCLNLQGMPQTLAPFPPIANPLALIEAAAEGIDPGSVLASLSAPLPNYRFSYLIAKAAELTSICQSFGKQLLDALEKNDAEGLALLRASQEITVQNLIQTFKQDQITEAEANVAALTAARNVPAVRYSFYLLLLGNTSTGIPAIGSNIPPISTPSQPTENTGGVQLLPEEQSELALSTKAALLHAGAGLLQTLASIEATIPNVSIGVDVQPFGCGGNVGVSFGGSNLAASTEAVVHGIETVANYLTYQAWSVGKMGGYFRRQQEWTLQANLAAAEIMQIDQQVNAAKIRVTVAQDDLKVTSAQVANAQAVQAYLQNKFTSQQLYTWMIGQVSSLYSQLYQLAYATAQQAEVAYQRELGVPESNYITFGYWDSLRKGLLAGEGLQLAVRQLELTYLNQNQREFEISRYVSLLLHDPSALMSLKTTGECVVQLPEQLFDLDYPGQYLRRLRDVSLTIPCVAGPYTNVNCTLTLVSSKVRFSPATGAYPESQGSDPRFIYYAGATAAIATSHAQDDSGVFTVNFRDERYLPFETAGAISTWMLTMPPACNAFDFDTITDVVFKLSYTARYGGDLLRSQAFAAASLPAQPAQTQAPAIPAAPKQAGRDRLFSVKHEFPTGWYGLLHPSAAGASYGQMPLWITPDRFGFQYRGRKITTADIEVFALLGTGATMTSMTVYLTQAPWPPPANPPVPPTPPVPDPGTDAVSLTVQPVYGTSALYGVRPQSTPTAVPQLWWLSIAAADLAEAVAQLEDFFVMFTYSVT
jgi:hypothetical protein